MLSGIIAKTTEFPLQLIGSVAGVSTARGGSDDDKAKRERRCFKRGHMSVFEHVSVTWRIEGISRACSHQLVAAPPGKLLPVEPALREGQH